MDQSASWKQQKASTGMRLLASCSRLRPQTHPVTSLSTPFLLIAPIIYGSLYFGLGDEFLPGHAPFCVLLIWITAVACADAAAWARLPRVVGMLVGGLVIANVPSSPLAAFPPEWGSQIRAAGLATIYLRCGLALEWHTLRRYQGPAITLAVVPGIVEMCFDAGVAVAVFGMPVLLAFTLGSLLQAVGPALLVPLLFKFQQERRGTHQGVPQAAIVSASFDDIIAITWFSIFSCLAIVGQGNVAWDIARGPVQVILGVVAGFAFGGVLSLTRVWDTQRKRVIATYFSCLLVMFILVYFNMLSGGALGSLVVGMTASAMWRRGAPPSRRLSLGPAPHFADDLEGCIAEIWDWVAEPAIFGTIGANVDFSALPGPVIGRALLIVCAGLLVRMAATFFCMRRCGGVRYPLRTRAFFAVAWTPKATVQAALSGVPLHLVRVLKRGAPDYQEWLNWGHQVQACGVMCILVCATLGTMLVQVLGPRLLDKAPSAEEEQERLEAEAAAAKRQTLANPLAVQGSALHSLVVQYMDLVEDFRRLAASPSGTAESLGDAGPEPLANAGEGGAAVPAGAGGSSGGGAEAARAGERLDGGVEGLAGRRPRQPLHQVALSLTQVEQHLRQHIGAQPLSVHAALELDAAVTC